MNLQKKEKQQAQQSYKTNTVKRFEKDSRRLRKTAEYYTSLRDSTKTPGNMANGNPVVPVMDWTEDAELHKHYVEWKEWS